MTVKINSVFQSISGEAGGFPQGTWCTFIRLQGCNLKCSWCDTKGAQDASRGHEMALPQIVSAVKTRHVLITGGEPLLQKDTKRLIQSLVDERLIIQVETNGSMPIPRDIEDADNLYWVMDYKCPSSGMTHWTMRKDILATTLLRPGVFIKFVIKDKDDLLFAMEELDEITKLMFLEKQEVSPKGKFIFSPLDGNGRSIPEWVQTMREHGSKAYNWVTFSIQLHKLFRLP